MKSPDTILYGQSSEENGFVFILGKRYNGHKNLSTQLKSCLLKIQIGQLFAYMFTQFKEEITNDWIDSTIEGTVLPEN